MEELNLFPEALIAATQVLFVNFGDTEAAHVMGMLKEIRESGINAELYPDNAKMKKQMKYANDKGVSYVAMVGENEMNSNMIQLKNMESGEQVSVSLEDLIKELKK